MQLKAGAGVGAGDPDEPAFPPPPIGRNQRVLNVYRGQGFLAVIRIGFFPTPSSLSKLDRRRTGRPSKRVNLLTGEGGEGVGEEPNHMTARKPCSL